MPDIKINFTADELNIIIEAIELTLGLEYYEFKMNKNWEQKAISAADIVMSISICKDIIELRHNFTSTQIQHIITCLEHYIDFCHDTINDNKIELSGWFDAVAALAKCKLFLELSENN